MFLSWTKCLMLVLSIGLCGCVSTAPEADLNRGSVISNNETINNIAPVPSPSRCLTHSDAKFHEKLPSGEKVGFSRIRGIRSASSIFFLNDKTGWAGGRNELWSTTDGGQEWKMVTRPYNDEYFVRFIQFLSSTRGSILLQKRTDDDYAGMMEIFDTEDGGHSWRKTHSEKGVKATGFHVSEDSGWVTGLKYDEESRVRISNFVLAEKKDSMEWQDVTGILKSLEGLSYDGTMGLLTFSDGATGVVTGTGKILKTTDLGETWNKIAEYPSKYFRINAVGVDAGDNAWIIGGEDNKDGTYSIIIYFPPIQSLSSCIYLNGLDNIILNGAFMGRDNRLIAYGVNVPWKENARTRTNLILESKDFGANWVTVFRSSTSSEFVASTNNDDFLFVIDESGAIVKVRL